MKEIRISDNEKNQRLDKFLLKYLNLAPKSFIYKMLRKKRIKLNSKKAVGNEMLLEGDLITMYFSPDTIDNFYEAKTIVETPITFHIVYEDKNILIVSKPSGLLSHSDSKNEKDTLINQVLYYLERKGEFLPDTTHSFTPALCNRLDRNTSGLVIAGKNLGAVQSANRAIADNGIEKYYITAVKGVIKEKKEVQGYITKNKDTNTVKISERESADSKKIITRYMPVADNGRYSLIEIKLITGRSHQIRAHLSFLGHPVIGDKKYGDANINRLFKEKFGVNSQLLHAYKLIFKNIDGGLSYLNGTEVQDSESCELEIIRSVIK